MSDCDFLAIANQLHQENVLVQDEFKCIKNFKKRISEQSENLVHVFCSTRMQQLCLKKLCIISTQEFFSAAKQFFSISDKSEFVRNNKDFVKCKNAAYSNLLLNFKSNPPLVASCLAIGYDLEINFSVDIVSTLMLCCYGNSFFTYDHIEVLKVLDILFLQLVQKHEGNYLIYQNSMFYHVFRLFLDFLLEGRSFLATALNPTMSQIVRASKLFLQTNQQKLITNLTPDEINCLFGSPEDSNFQKSIEAYVHSNKRSLYNICASILSDLFSALPCFSQSLGWLIARIYSILTSVGEWSDAQACSFCAELFLSEILCPAILNPELYDIIPDVPISDLCQFNCQQIAQTLQKALEFTEKTVAGDYNADLSASLHLFIKTLIDDFAISVPSNHDKLSGWRSSFLLITPSRLSQLIQYLRDLEQSKAPGLDVATLGKILSDVPSQLPSYMQQVARDDFSNSAANTESNGAPSPIKKVKNLTPSKTLKKEHRHEKVNELDSPSLPKSNHSQTDINGPVLIIPLQEETEPSNILSEIEFFKQHPPHEFASDQNDSNNSLTTGKENTSRNSIIKRKPSIFNKLKSVKQNSKSYPSKNETSPATARNDHDDDVQLEMKPSKTVYSRFASVIKVNSNSRYSSKDGNDLDSIDDGSASRQNFETTSLVDINTLTATRYNSDFSDISLPPDLSNDSTKSETMITSANSFKEELRKIVTFDELILPHVESADASLDSDFLINQTPGDEVTSDNSFNEDDLEEKSLSKAQQILGVSLQFGESFHSRMEQEQSRRKAERMLGVSLSLKHELLNVRSKSYEDLSVKMRTNKFGKFKKKFSMSHLHDLEKSLRRWSLKSLPENQTGFKQKKSLTKALVDDKVLQKYQQIHFSSIYKDKSSSEYFWSDTESNFSAKTFSRKSPNLKPETNSILHLASVHRDSFSSSISHSKFYHAIATSNGCDVIKFAINAVEPPSVASQALMTHVEKNLRKILSSSDPPMTSYNVKVSKSLNDHKLTCSTSSKSSCRSQIIAFFRILLSKAQHQYNKSDCLLFTDMIRCVEALDEGFCKALTQNISKDIKHRSRYLAYLVQTKQKLLLSLTYIRNVTESLEQEANVVRNVYILICVRSFIKTKKISLSEFRSQFCSVASDEKVTLINSLIADMHAELVKKLDWEDLEESILDKVKFVIEDRVFEEVYEEALFPNGDADNERDLVFQQMIQSLSNQITPEHPSLAIPDKYLPGYPWQQAQDEARMLSAQLTPHGKLKAAVKCCQAVTDLLTFSHDKQAPAADDIFPVLVFVLIKANPPHLLSTRDYIENFIKDQLQGIESYLWVLFNAALAFINKMSTG